MEKYQKVCLFLVRVSLGWFFFYAGITKIVNPEWSAAGFLNSAKVFPGFYHSLASSSMLGLTNFVNEWALLLLGLSLIFGVFVRLSAPLGAVLMLLYYFPQGLPKPNPNAYIVDQHIIYVFTLLYLATKSKQLAWGLDSWWSKKTATTT